MVLITRSLDKIDPRVGSNGIKCATLPKQFAAPPQGDDDDDGKVTSTADYTVQDKTNLPLIVEMLEKYGIVIVKDLVSPPACDAIVGELEPHFFRDPSWNGSPFPKQTTVATRTVLKSKTAVEQILCHQLFSKVSAHFLSERERKKRKAGGAKREGLRCVYIIYIADITDSEYIYIYIV